MVQQWYFQFQITPVFIVRVCFTQAPPCPAEPVKLSLARHSRRKPGNQVCLPFFKTYARLSYAARKHRNIIRPTKVAPFLLYAYFPSLIF